MHFHRFFFLMLQPEEVQMQNMSLYGGNQAMYASHPGNHLVSSKTYHLSLMVMTIIILLLGIALLLLTNISQTLLDYNVFSFFSPSLYSTLCDHFLSSLKTATENARNVKLISLSIGGYYDHRCCVFLKKIIFTFLIYLVNVFWHAHKVHFRM